MPWVGLQCLIVDFPDHVHFLEKMFTRLCHIPNIKVSKGAKIRNRYNQVPHLTQDTNGKVTNSQQAPQTRAKRSALSQQVTTKHINCLLVYIFYNVSFGSFRTIGLIRIYKSIDFNSILFELFFQLRHGISIQCAFP